jgi:hypothetical protein
MAANPTPSVIPTKNFPSRVNFSRRVACSHVVDHGVNQFDGAGEASGIGARDQSGTGMRADDFSQRALGFVARGHEPVGLSREANTMRKDGNGQIVDVVGDAIVPSAEQGAGPRGVTERHGRAGRRAEREQRRRSRRHDEGVQIVRERRVDGDALDLALQATSRAGSSTQVTSRAVSVCPSSTSRISTCGGG